MSDKRTARDMGELLQDPTYAGILVPVVPDLEWRILKTIEASPQSFEMGDWVNECGTTLCLGGHATLIADQECPGIISAVDQVDWPAEDGVERVDQIFGAAPALGQAMWRAIGKTPPDFYNESNEEALADLRARVAADLDGVGGGQDG